MPLGPSSPTSHGPIRLEWASVPVNQKRAVVTPHKAESRIHLELAPPALGNREGFEKVIITRVLCPIQMVRNLILVVF